MQTRSTVISHHVRLAIAHSGLTVAAYASAVAARYHADVPLHLRGISFHDSGDVYADQRANAQIVSRMLDGGAVRMPADIEEAMVLCLPQPYQGELQRELAARLGLLAAPLPKADGARSAVHIGELVRETGEMITALAPMLANGHIAPAAVADVRRVLKELRDVMGLCTSLESALITTMAQGTTQAGANVAPLRRAAM